MNKKAIVVGTEEWNSFKDTLGITPEEYELARLGVKEYLDRIRSGEEKFDTRPVEWLIGEQKDIGAEYEQTLLNNLDDLYEE